MVSVNSHGKTARHRGSPLGSPPLGQQSFQKMQQRSQYPPSNRRASYAFCLVVVLFTLMSLQIIDHYPSELFYEIDADLKKTQVDIKQDNSHVEPKSPTNFRKVLKPDVVEASGDRRASNEKIDEGSADAGNLGDDKGFGEQKDGGSVVAGNSGDDKDSDEKEDKGSANAGNSKDGISDDKNGDEESEDMYFRDPKAPVTNWHYYPRLKRKPRRDPSWKQAGKLNSALKKMKKEECDRFMANIDTSPPPLREPSNKACTGYDGVLQIQHYDAGGASGAAFFLFNIGMLAWADQHNYLPWIHIEDDFTLPIWDPIVHTNRTKITEFTMLEGMEIDLYRDPDDRQWFLFPGRPSTRGNKLEPKNNILGGTGVWEHYFLPVNDFAPGDMSCRKKPLLKMDDDSIVPGIHTNAPWAPRAWRYGAADYILRDDLTWDEWFKPQRERGAQMTERYIRFNPMMEKRAHCAFPKPEFSLGMHIRHSDKEVERRVIETDEFLPFAEAFVENGGGAIYVATDSTKVVTWILKKWPDRVKAHVVYQPSVMGRSTNTTAAFNIGVSRHRTNVEALTDILALSKCTFLLHGLSAMSEAAMYLNRGLVTRSKNLEEYDIEDKDEAIEKFEVSVKAYSKEYKREKMERKKRRNKE